MRKASLILICMLLIVTSFGQLPKKMMKEMGPNPIIFLDSVQTDMNSLEILNPFDISNISILKPKTANKLLGDIGKDGAIYITTVTPAKNIYWNYFRSRSDDYKKHFSSPQADTLIEYILNGETLSDNAATGKLFMVNDKNLKSIHVVDKADGKYMMDDVIQKRYIVVITAKRPKELVRKKNRK